MGGSMGPGWMRPSLLLGLGPLTVASLGVTAGTPWLLRDPASPDGGRRTDCPLERFRERDARREISRDEFQRMRREFS